MTTITLPRAVVEQALEALTVAWQQNPRWQITESMHALRAALAHQAEPAQAQRCRAEPRSDGDFVCDCKIGDCSGRSAEPAQEPVAYIHRQGNHWEVSERHLDSDEKSRGWTEEPLYTAPPQQVAQQAEPLNLRDPAVQKRLATQWGYVPAAAQAEPVEPHRWEGDNNIESPFNACMHKTYCMTLKQAEPVEPVATLTAQRDALLEALKTYGWHTEDCPQYPTHARPKNWPACTCGFDAAIKAVEGEK